MLNRCRWSNQAQQEVKQMQDDIDKLKKQAKDIKALLEKQKAASAAPPAAGAHSFLRVGIDVR